MRAVNADEEKERSTQRQMKSKWQQIARGGNGVIVVAKLSAARVLVTKKREAAAPA